MTTLDKGALDRWITTEPNWHEVVLVTEENFSEFYGKDGDLLLNELKCSWSGEHVGYTDWESGDDYGCSFKEFYALDEDREILVNAEAYDGEQERVDAHERKLDAEYAEYQAQQVQHNHR